MQTSLQGLELILEREGLKTAAYPDPSSRLFKACLAAHINPYDHGYRNFSTWESYSGEPWTISVGHTGAVRPGDECTQEKAMEWLRSDMAWAEAAINLGARPIVSAGLMEQFQWDALGSFILNIGQVAFFGSTMLKMINAGDVDGAILQFDRWHIPPEIISRRNGEREQFAGRRFEARID